MKHHVNTKGVRSQCGAPGHSDTVITCSCGWEETKRHARTTDPEVNNAILYHRIASIEKEVGIDFKRTFGERGS